MLAGALTFPLIGENGTGTWANQLGSGSLEHTVLTVLGVHNGWLAVAPLRRSGRRDRLLHAGHATVPNGGHAAGRRRAARLGRGRGCRAQRGGGRSFPSTRTQRRSPWWRWPWPRRPPLLVLRYRERRASRATERLVARPPLGERIS